MMHAPIGPHGITCHYRYIGSDPLGGQEMQKGPDIHLAAFVIDDHVDAPLLRVAVDRRGD